MILVQKIILGLAILAAGYIGFLHYKNIISSVVSFNQSSESPIPLNGNPNFTVDASHVYSYGSAVLNADPKTFVLLNSVYEKDASHVYYGREDISPILNADSSTFSVLDNSTITDSASVDDKVVYAWRQDYATDKNHVYNGGKIIDGADPTTFVLLNTYYAKDKNHNYYIDKIVQESNQTYQLYSDSLYINKQFGFQIQMPSTWTKYAVRVAQDNFREGTLITFGLPLSTDILVKSLKDPEKSARVLNIDQMEVMTVAYYDAHKHDCDTVDGPCSFPIEIARNNQYVFGLKPNPHAGWNYCADANGMEPYVCMISNDVYKNGQDFIETGFKLNP